MKLFKHISISIALTLGIFFAVMYVSCSKDACKGVTCINGGTCNGGSCSCKTGIGGNSCETIYRNLYAFTYSGMVNGAGMLDSLTSVDSNSYKQTLVFMASNDTTDYNSMSLSWNDSLGKLIVNMPITLKNNSLAGSDFTIAPVNSDTFTYSGSGNVSTVSASMILTRTHPHGPSTVVFTFNNFSRQ